MMRINYLVIYIFVIALPGCASRPNFPTIEDPTQRFIQVGYSLIPTDELGWVLAARSPNNLVLAKQGAGADETFAIQATLIELPAFHTNEQLLDIIRQGQQADIDPMRFSVKKHEVLHIKVSESPCGRSHILALDNSAVKRSREPLNKSSIGVK